MTGPVALEDDHRHCKVCGRVCGPTEETCGPACAEVRERRARSRRTYLLLIYGMALLLLLLLVSPYIAHV